MEAKVSLDNTRWRFEDAGPDGVSRRQVSHVSIYLGLESRFNIYGIGIDRVGTERMVYK